jgi:hypothetical protein
MLLTDIDVCNQALALCGADRIDSFDAGTAEAIQCSAHYETTVRACLTAPGGKPMRWSFATRQDTLAKVAGSPVGRWEHGYQLPTGCLQVHAVLDNDVPVAFAIYGDKVMTDVDGALVIDHTFRAGTNLWAPFFTDALVAQLARKLALALNRDAELARIVSPDWQGARTADSQQRTARRIRATRLIGARFVSRNTGRSGY